MERKLATVLFVDLVASTELVADADPEVVRRRVSRFFDQVSHCIVTHGGTVEKFAGDAVMAAFGVPLAHEDDAERAVRAGARDARARARARPRGAHRHRVRRGRRRGRRVDVRDRRGRQPRLAPPDRRRAERDPRRAGRGEPRCAAASSSSRSARSSCAAGASRSPRIASSAPSSSSEPLRSLSAPLVGRESELELLENTYERTVRDRRAALFTIYGDPGVGKSRLAREFVAGLEGATVLTGRCLPYGEGVTYWPLAEMVKASSGITDDDPLDEAQKKLRDYCEDEAVADLLGLAVGVLEAVEGERAQQEIAWAARAWAEQLAAGAAARPRLRGRALGRGAAARAARAPRLLGARGAAPDRLPRAARAPRRAPDLGRRPRPRDDARARAAAGGGERGSSSRR